MLSPFPGNFRIFRTLSLVTQFSSKQTVSILLFLRINAPVKIIIASPFFNFFLKGLPGLDSPTILRVFPFFIEL